MRLVLETDPFNVMEVGEKVVEKGPQELTQRLRVL